MKTKANKIFSSLWGFLRKLPQTALDRMAEILHECDWFPAPRQTKLPPF